MIRKPPFLEDKAPTKYTIDKLKMTPAVKEDKSEQIDPKEKLLLDGMIKNAQVWINK
mgnify:CR=1 FL=1